MRNDAQLKYPLYEPKNFKFGNGIAHTKPNMLNTINGTHIQ